MKTRRTLVVGSGAGGLTLALLLAKAGRSVTLIEKQSSVGGYLRRFVRSGSWWDSGYHFSGGFQDVLKQFYQILGIGDRISSKPISNRIVLQSAGKQILLPAGCGLAGAREIFCGQFSECAKGLGELFGSIQSVWDSTWPGKDLYDLTPLQMDFSHYDTITVRDHCRSLGLSEEAEAAAGSFASCHGTPPGEAPMSFHARVGFSLYDSLARPVRGGSALIEAFQCEAAKMDVEIRTGTELLRFAEPGPDGECHEALFADGCSLPVDEVFFTIHPLSVRDLLPESVQTRSFLRRCARLRETTSFFCVYYLADDSVELPEGLVSCLSENDLDRILKGESGSSTGYMIVREPDVRGAMRSQITAFRTMPCGTPAFAAGMPHREREQDGRYCEFKEQTAQAVTKDLLSIYPQLTGHLQIVATGSPLSCLDYDPPTGSAYGARCICGQSRLCGRLPVKNFHIAGQSAMVPGVMGSMMASLLVFRLAAGDAVYRRVIDRSLS